MAHDIEMQYLSFIRRVRAAGSDDVALCANERLHPKDMSPQFAKLLYKTSRIGKELEIVNQLSCKEFEHFLETLIRSVCSKNARTETKSVKIFPFICL